MKTDSDAEKPLHRCLKLGRRSDPHLVGKFNDGFALTGSTEMQKDRGWPTIFKECLTQLH
jgi:hypothetical protein